MPGERRSVFLSLETANPPLRRSRDFALAFMERVGAYPEAMKPRIERLYERSGIDFRYSCVEDFGRTPELFEFFPQNWSLKPEPSTAARNRTYREQSVPLAEDVAARSLAASGCTPGEVTHVITVSCTGSFTPGLDIELVRRLGLPPSVSRTSVGFMGCYAAFNAMRAADAFCQTRPDARVLVLCLELCTIHFRVGDSMEDAVVNSLFSDGAAAFVMGSMPYADARGRPAYVLGRSALDEDSLDYMTWDIGDNGFEMGLSPRVPSLVSRLAPAVADPMLADHGATRDDVSFWAIHPGGRDIVDRTAQALGLTAADVHDSMEVLRLHGNMSSPTILFVLKRLFDRLPSTQTGNAGTDAGRLHDHSRPAQLIAALGFGPGLTVEGCLIEVVP